MEIDYASSLLICNGCLSLDREITPVKDGDSKMFFEDTLGHSTEISEPLLLCWECRAIVKKMVHFKRQVRTAHEYLMNYAIHYNHHSSLSHLSTKTQTSIIEINHDEVANDILLTKLELEHDNIEDLSENDDSHDDKADVHNDRYDDNVLKAVLELIPKTDLSKSDIPVPYSDSDDEPLVKLTEKRGKRKKKKRKKEVLQEQTESKRRRRENPPGVVDNERVRKVLKELNVESGCIQMVVLSWKEVAEERAKALKSHMFTRHEYKCHDCIQGFNHKIKLEAHMKKHDASAGESVCHICKVRFKDSHGLIAHRRRHRVRWRCCSCGATSSRAAVSADHYAREHGAAAPTHVCAVCGHSETSLAKLRNHLKNHAERQKCEVCGKTFRDRNTLKAHLFIHRAEKEYACPQCNKKFLFKKSMEIHLITHEASAQLYCVQCDMTFKNQMSYYQHTKYNLKHIDPAKLKYACNLCNKKFAKSQRLEEHHTAVHLKMTPIRCPENGCNFACSSRTVLRSHNRVVHRGKRPKKNHVCHTCGKSYTSNKSLEAHIRSHTGERPFHCALCPVSFGYEAALYNHNKLVHLKIKRGKDQPPPVPAPTNWHLEINITQPQNMTQDNIS